MNKNTHIRIKKKGAINAGSTLFYENWLLDFVFVRLKRGAKPHAMQTYSGAK